MTMLLGAVAAISLLVGGMGIMNIMLVSVTTPFLFNPAINALSFLFGALIGAFSATSAAGTLLAGLAALGGRPSPLTP